MNAAKIIDDLAKNHPKINDLFLHQLKLTIEETQERKSRLFKDYEFFRFKKIKDIDEVVLEAYCFSCKIFSIMSMKTMDYLDMYVESHVSKRYISDILCKKCDKDYLHFEALVPL